MKYITTTIISLMLVAILVFLGTASTTNGDYLRIHIRANSNASIDQAVKYQVKDAVVDYMIPLLCECETMEESKIIMEENLNNIEKVAETVLIANNFTYTATAKLSNEEFPTRTYGELTLESGFYDAVILELGSGSGDNWWCVVYPPLCFVNGSSSVNSYKSRILEILENLGIKF